MKLSIYRSKNNYFTIGTGRYIFNIIPYTYCVTGIGTEIRRTGYYAKIKVPEQQEL